MDVCYCANYYCNSRCTNKVNSFGQRCRLCIVTKTGSSLSPGLLPDDCPWSLPCFERESEHDSSSSASSSEGSGLMSWASSFGLGALALSPLFKQGSSGTVKKGRGTNTNERDMWLARIK